MNQSLVKMKINKALLLWAWIKDQWLRATVNKSMAACPIFSISPELMLCVQTHRCTKRFLMQCLTQTIKKTCILINSCTWIVNSEYCMLFSLLHTLIHMHYSLLRYNMWSGGVGRSHRQGFGMLSGADERVRGTCK